MGRIIGIILILLIAILARRIQLEGTEQQKGVVTDVKMIPAPRRRPGGGEVALPVVTFQYYGKTYQSRSDMAPKFFNSYDIGDSIMVYFPRSQPKLAEVYTFTAYWFSLPFIAVVLLIVIAWLGIHNIITMHSQS